MGRSLWGEGLSEQTLSSTSALSQQGVKLGKLREKQELPTFCNPALHAGVQKLLLLWLSAGRSALSFSAAVRSSPAIFGPAKRAEVELRNYFKSRGPMRKPWKTSRFREGRVAFLAISCADPCFPEKNQGVHRQECSPNRRNPRAAAGNTRVCLRKTTLTAQ